MIRTALTLDVSLERVNEVVEFYDSADILQYSLDHSEALASELSIALDGSGVIMVTDLWPSSESYQGWLDNPWRASSGDELRKFLREGEVGAGMLFEVVQSVERG
jgi:hypothetical protein